MTPKEALKRIETVKAWNGGVYRQYTSSTEPFMEDIINVEEALTELEELKRYPTSEEVCEAIQRDLEIEKVVYDKGRFYDEDDGETIVRMWEDGTITFDEYILLNLKTLSLVIRFYEGLGK